MKTAIIGRGAIATFVRESVTKGGVEVGALIVRPGKEGPDDQGLAQVSAIADLPPGIDLVVDCAGHEGLRAHGIAALEAGHDVLTVSIGALADSNLMDSLTAAAVKGGGQLHLASGAIGALDALRAARAGGLACVKYTGRKPPMGWKGSPAEERLDLAGLTQAKVHFLGSAREAALAYPKNANVAAAVALASLGFDDTIVELIADPSVTANIHQIEASGDFGEMTFSVSGTSLPDNPRSSALAAMSVVAALLEQQSAIRF
ncbi:MAG: aspartate dehydrogenase [Paracoccaceae bacterium]